MNRIEAFLEWIVPTGGERGVSETVSFVLLIGMVVSVSGVLVVGGATLVSNLSDDLESDRAEKSLQQLNSHASVVALSNTDSAEARLPADGGEYRVREDAGNITITARNVTDGDPTVLRDTTFGTIVYRNGDNEVAYQGGGVWRKGATSSGMVSPPEFHYRDGTLTFPIIKLTGSPTLSNQLTISKQSSANVFPDNSISGDLEGVNPIRGHNLTVTIESEYYRGWGQYFEQRTDTEPSYNHDTNTVSAKLVPPPTPVTADSAITTTGNLDLDGTTTVDGDVTLGGTLNSGGASSVTGTVEENVIPADGIEPATSVIQSAETRLSGESDPGGQTVTAGQYHVDDSSLFNNKVTFDTSGGDIELFVDGDLKTGKNVEINGNNDVKLYIDGVFWMKSQPVWGDSGSVDQFTVYTVDTERITQLYGILYTDAVDIKGSGSRYGIQGAMISTASTVDLGGNVGVDYDPVLADTVIDEVNTPLATITYLHISEHTIQVND